MSSKESDTKTLLEALIHDPENEELLNQARLRIRTGDGEFDDAAHSLAPQEPQGLHTQWHVSAGNYWANCIGEQSCQPVQIRKPKGLQDLIDAVNHGREHHLNVRAVGSGHSFSNVAPTIGILLDPKEMNHILAVDTRSLRHHVMQSTLFAVESGITIRALNAALDKAGLALINMGAYDGQTLAGAISTGTHGKGLSLGPIASSVRSLVLVSETGKVYQVEPSDGISDPAKFEANHDNITLKQDDDWFQSIVIAMGCMGVIYSYTIEVVPRYFLEETRSLKTWEGFKSHLAMEQGGPFPTVLTSNRHFEVDINPYTINKVHSCIVDITNEVKTDHASGSRGFAYWLSGLLASWPKAVSWLVWFLNHVPILSPEIINSALSALVDTNYIDKSFNVLSVGAVDNVKALAMELSFPVDDKLVDAIDNLLAVFADEASRKIWYLAGPIALRFVAPSQAYLAPQEGRYTCMVEMDMLYGVKSGEDLLKAVKERICMEGSAVRVHWGLDLDTVRGEEVRRTYAKYEKWLEVYRTLNSTGMFNSAFTERLGISVMKPSEDI